MIRLLLIDIDGTLVGDDKLIPAKNRKAIHSLLAKKIIVTLVTGRNYHSSKEVLDTLHEDVPIVFQNGAFIYRPISKTIITKKYLQPNIAEFLLKKGRENNLYTLLYTDFLESIDMYIETKYAGIYEKYLERNQYRMQLVPDLLDIPRHSISEVVFLGQEDNIQKINADTEFMFPGQFSPIKSFDAAGEIFFEFFGKSVSKSNSVLFLSEYFQIPLSDIMFIGDSYNDIEAMKIVGMPVAMGNAIKEVKELAGFISKTNNDAGVAHAIESLL